MSRASADAGEQEGLMTDADIIAGLGGCVALARKFRKTKQAISKWRKGIPNNRRIKLAQLAYERGFKLPSGFLIPKPDRRAKK